MFIFHYSNIPVVPDGGPYIDPQEFAERLQAAGPVPEIPPPCWDRRPIDPAACEAATRALCA